jgi:formamidopyrimidine-DNA glycosylase
MPEVPKLTVVQEVLNRRIIGQTIVSAEVMPPGGPIVVGDLTGEGFAPGLADTRFESYPGGPVAT